VGSFVWPFTESQRIISAIAIPARVRTRGVLPRER
jgi:hypothetical protein